jgi:hypothetical protein
LVVYVHIITTYKQTGLSRKTKPHERRDEYEQP